MAKIRPVPFLMNHLVKLKVILIFILMNSYNPYSVSSVIRSVKVSVKYLYLGNGRLCQVEEDCYIQHALLCCVQQTNLTFSSAAINKNVDSTKSNFGAGSDFRRRQSHSTLCLFCSPGTFWNIPGTSATFSFRSKQFHPPHHRASAPIELSISYRSLFLCMSLTTKTRLVYANRNLKNYRLYPRVSFLLWKESLGSPSTRMRIPSAGVRLPLYL